MAAGRLANKACIVTGAGSGIGKATAIRFAEEGAKVLCVDLNPSTVKATVEEIFQAQGQAVAVAADISDRAQVQSFTQRCIELYGSIDVLVNNAGVNLPSVFHEASDADIDRTLDVNVKGTMYCAQAAIPQML